MGLGLSLTDDVVTEINPDSQAARGGRIKVGDRVVAVNGEAPTTAKPSSTILQGVGAGTTVKLEFAEADAAAKKAEADAAAKKKAEADAAAKNPVSIKLEELGLTQYADALGEQGYTSMASFKNMTSEEAGALADEVKMKPGHKRSFIRAFTAAAEADAAAKKKAEAEAAAKNPVSIKLEEHGLAQYADALGEQGYDSMVSFNNMTNEEAGALADELKMKPGHKRAFITAFACE